MTFFLQKNIQRPDSQAADTYSFFCSSERKTYWEERDNVQNLQRQCSNSKFIKKVILTNKIHRHQNILFKKAESWLHIMDKFFIKHSPKATPADIDISRCLLSHNGNNSNKACLQYYSFLFHEYLSGYLLKRISQDNIIRFVSKIDYLSIDFEAIAYCIEKENNKKLPPIYQTSGHRSCLNKADLMFAARSLFYIESIGRIEDIWDSDLIPAAISYIRLSIDLCLQKLIPYKAILDSKSNKECHITGLRKKFVENQIKNKSSNVSSLDDFEMIVAIYEWSCDAVHYGYLYIDCVTDWVMSRVFSLFEKASFVDKNIMKTDFDVFVTSKYTVIW